MITRKITKIIIHHTDYPHGKDLDIYEVTRWHVKDNGWDDIGYHFLILEDGSIQIGRDLNTPGAHARGHNQDSIGIALSGKDKFNDIQFLSLKLLLNGLKKQLSIENKNIIGHNKVSNKSCPNFDVQAFKSLFGL